MQSYLKVFVGTIQSQTNTIFNWVKEIKKLNSILFKRRFNNQFEIKNFDIVDNGYGLRKILILLPL